MARARNPKRAQAKEKTKQVVKKPVSGFMDFVREQSIVGLAIGLAIGTQANATVKALVDGFITPIVGFVVGSQDGLLLATWNVVGVDTAQTDFWITLGKRLLVFKWGMVLSSIITLTAVLAVIFFVVKGLKLDKLDKKKEEKK